MFFLESETVLGRIHDHLAVWRAGRAGAELMVLMRGEFHALKSVAEAAGFDDISVLSHSVERLLAQSGEVVSADDVGLLNLLEEVHDGLVADLGFVPASSRTHVKSLNSLVASLLSGDELQTESARSPLPLGPPLGPPGVPVSTFDDTLPRLRDLVGEAAEQGGRAVEVSLSGGDIEVARPVVESMMVLFECLIRGSVRHGIESAEQRTASGKTAGGRISIAVAQRERGAELVLEYADDGRGLDGGKLAARAVETGMTHNAGEVSAAHFLQIITRPSTPGTANPESGGGLEVVRRAVCEFGGLMAVKSERAKGVRFRIQLPAAPRAHREREREQEQVLLVTVGKYRFAIAAPTIERVMRIRKEEVVARAERRYVSAGGRQIPIVSLAERIGERAVGRGQAAILLVLIRLGDRIAAFEVDGFHGIIPLVPKPPGAQLASIRGVAGVGVLADSSMVVVLDSGAFIERGLLEHEGLIRFPLGDLGYGLGLDQAGVYGGGNLTQAPVSGAVTKKTMRVIVLETPSGPLVIPAGLVAAIVGVVERQPSGREHSWVCGELHWRGLRVPVINPGAFGADNETVSERVQPGGYCVILWPLKGDRADWFFALPCTGRPRAVAIDASPARARSATGRRPDNVLGYVALEWRTGMIPDLKSLARGIFHDC